MGFIFGILFRILFFMIEMFIRIVIFTGAWMGLALIYVIDKIILFKLFNISITMQKYPNFCPIYETFLMGVIIVVPIIYTLFKLYRMVKKYMAANGLDNNREAIHELTMEEAAVIFKKNGRDINEIKEIKF